MNIIETIRKEIERRKNNAETMRERGAYISLLDFLDTLPEQPVEGLEEEIRRYLREECSGDDEPLVSEIARHFAEWGASHAKTPTP